MPCAIVHLHVRSELCLRELVFLDIYGPEVLKWGWNNRSSKVLLPKVTGTGKCGTGLHEYGNHVWHARLGTKNGLVELGKNHSRSSRYL